MKKNINKFDYYLGIGLIVLIIIVFYLGNIYIQDEKLCQLDPLNYGVNQLEELNHAQLSCSCVIMKGDGALIYFDGNNYTFEVMKKQNVLTEDINYSNLFKKFT